MPILSFDSNGSCSLPPFNLVSNRLFFFRVNAFEIDLPLESQAPDPHRGVRVGDLATGIARLGIPISDLFPHLMPEFGASAHTFGHANLKVRLDRNIFLPALKANRLFDAVQPVQTSPKDLSRGKLDVGQRQMVLSKDVVAELNAGRPVTLAEGRSLVRLLPPPDDGETSDEAPPRFLMFRSGSSSSSESSAVHLNELSVDQFDELCDLLFEHLPSSRFPSVDHLSSKERAKLMIRCKRDPRYAAWDKDRPGKYRPEPPRYEIGFVSEYEQLWQLVGYSRGGLVSSITLAPEEELTIEVFTWDRAKLEQEDTETTESERSVESTGLARVSAQVNSDLTETTDKKANIGLGAPLPVQGVKADGQVSVSDVLTQGINTTVQTINETTRKASERFKTTTQIKVVQTRETGTETRVTRKIRNPNSGRTLTMHCFEVMEHYQVTTSLVRADKFVLLADIPQPKSFDIRFILAYEEKLQRALLGPNYLPGFVAAKKLLAQQFFDERSRIKAEIEAAQAKARADQAAPQDEPPIVAVARQLRDKLNSLIKIDIVKEMATLADSYLPFGDKISEKERAAANDALGMFNFWLKFKLVTPGIDSKAQAYISAVPGNISAKQAYDALLALTSGLDDEWLTTVKMVAATVVSAQLAFTLIPVFPWLTPVLLEFAVIENNLGVPSLIDKAKQQVRAYEATLKVPPPPTDGDKADAKAFAPPQLFSLQELALADAEFKKLQLHLEANRVFYLNSLFAQLDANVRYETLRTLGIHNFVENRLLGFIGSRAVFPLRIETLEQDTQDYLTGKLTSNLQALLAANVAPIVEDLSLPTNGLHMEPVLGQCDALEPFLAKSRVIELEAAAARASLARESANQLAIENARRQQRIDAGNLDSFDPEP